eukprot:UN32073
MGDHKPSWFDPTWNIPKETNDQYSGRINDARDATKDPFDTVFFPEPNFSGVDTFDNVHGNINDAYLAPQNPHAFASFLHDDISMTGEVVAVSPSEHGKFRTIIVNDA